MPTSRSNQTVPCLQPPIENENRFICVFLVRAVMIMFSDEINWLLSPFTVLLLRKQYPLLLETIVHCPLFSIDND